jgi:FkbM family methyltransferase
MLLKEVGKAKARILAVAGYEPPRIIEPEENGEYRFLRWLSGLPEIGRFDSVIDVGANHGDWTEAAHVALGKRGIRTFHCVEPIPWLADTIRKRFSSSASVDVVEVALSDVGGGEVTIYGSGGGGTMYRSYRGNDAEGAVSSTQKKYVEFKVQLKKGDELFSPPSIKPYLLKVDCDGHDYKVLAGFRELLSRKRPVVQFEYCDFWIGSDTRLRDACKLLRGFGYRTYKMFPDRLVRFRYNTMFETFGYQNIVAAPAEMKSFASSTLMFGPDAG